MKTLPSFPFRFPLALLLLLAACSPAAVTLPPFPTASPQPASTSSPSPTPGPLVLDSFSSTLEGTGARGTVACIHYNGDPADLEEITLSAIIIQGVAKERDVLPEQIDGRTCFEMTDALYVSVDPQDGSLVIPKVTVSIRLTASSAGGREIQNGVQLLEPGTYIQFPFLDWIYATRDVCRSSAHFRTGDIAWDLIPRPTPDHPTLVNTPILSPLTGMLFPADGEDIFSGNTVMIYSPGTGYVIGLSHAAGAFVDADGGLVLQSDQPGMPVDVGEVVAMIGEKDEESGMPHTRMQVEIPGAAVDLSMPASEITAFLQAALQDDPPGIDFIGMHLFRDRELNALLEALPDDMTDCRSLPSGELSLPLPKQDLPFTIDGYAYDWEGQIPLLTDPQGDALSGKLDLTELAAARDEHYLYLMVRTGKDAAVERELDLYLDSLPGRVCGFADEMLFFWSAYPDSAFITDLNGCEPGDRVNRYAAVWAWEEVLEVKLPLVFFPQAVAWEITGARITVNHAGSWDIPDSMP